MSAVEGTRSNRGEDDLPPLWADVLLDPETHTPTLLSDEDRAVVNEALADLLAGQFIERCWIQAGPLAERTPTDE